ncbi:hypothetical protein CC86DRAFT_354346 [Ophiobolus disseminans]|uniref:HAUS augmin-like complex subunit 6 N-terminal domain-containing protein n=1 Tax=Ophiobolus disseminans TaxID=1469910 RepID=A0A6A6ZU43_9PLEO|nr:hypothetical protein CC86DRAFT_354346 [Ophiobolus disseminans]
MSRSTSQASTATTNVSGHGRTLSMKTTTKAQSLNPIPTPDIKLFVTNLRLLDFDLRNDWPAITVQTFSAKNADQRQRISGTEWALFRLFEIWDPNETAQKLQPFFPPLEPLQSLNLRAALYRCLNDLKKNGVLGRESVLRKTMLDECKGDKFYEILALFSNVVLKKVLAARESNTRDAAIARKLATMPMLRPDQQQSLLPLAIAHKAALVSVLKKKEEKRRRYMEFQALLDAKADDINRRIRKTKDTPRAKRPAVSQKEADAVKKQLKDNWIGDQVWLDIMLHGDDVQAGDAFLSSRFDKVWRMVEAGKKLEDVVPETGLLENLQSRVQEQQDRLEKWKSFHAKLQKDKAESASPAPKAPAPSKEFIFDNHLRYQLPSSKQKETETTTAQQSALRSDYQDILTDMNTQLLQVTSSKPARPTVSLTRTRTSSTSSRSPARRGKLTRSESIPEESASPIRAKRPLFPTKKSSFENAPILRPTRHVPFVATPTDSEATLIGHTSALQSTATRTEPVEEHQYAEPERDTTPSTANSPQETSSSPPAPEYVSQPACAPHSPEPSTTYPSEPPTPCVEPPTPYVEPPVLNPEEVLAEQIITSIGDATPSPVKKPQPRMSLSLIERTRMSMARTTSFEPIAESPLPEPSPELPSHPTIEPEADHRATLLERTRLSMLAMESKPRKSLGPKEKRKSSRDSLFPVNQFDTPRHRKSIVPVEEEVESERTPKEALFSDEIDYERVFKSRPKIATSPVWSPPREDEDVDGVTGIDLGDVDIEGEDAGWGVEVESPSRGRGRY